jgi:hypothetical protein
MRAEDGLKQRGLERESGIRIKSLIGLRIPSFTANPEALAGTQTGIVHGGAARGASGRGGFSTRLKDHRGAEAFRRDLGLIGMLRHSLGRWGDDLCPGAVIGMLARPSPTARR